MDYKTLPVREWVENHVKCWLESTGIKKEYVDKLHAEEVTGPALMELDESFLKDIGMKKGQIQILIHKRNELLRLQDNAQQAEDSSSKTHDGRDAQTAPARASNAPAQGTVSEGSSGAVGTTSSESTAPASGKKPKSSKKSQLPSAAEVLEVRNYRPFRSQDTDFRYVKDTVLPPESGVSDLIIPCHEYKSCDTAAELNKQQLQSKFASEVIRFASACMNIRTNGTIHFGVMDSVENKGWKHGQIVGIKVKKREDFVDALDYNIEKCFCNNLQEIARKCIHPPVFVEVISKDSQEQRFVVEVDIEPTFSLVKNNCFEVYLPKYNESSQKVILTKEPALYQRLGAKSEPVQRSKLTAFIQAMPDRDAQRERAELSSAQVPTEIPQDLGRKLSILLNDGKSYMDDSLRYILVTNRCEQDNLNHIDFLMHLNIFCVFDFDEHSNVSGLYSKYKEHHETSSYFLQDFFKEIKTDNSPSQKLFDQTSWIFCNGRSDFLGDEKACDENTWIRTKKKYLKKVITCICEEILPEGSFIVLFLLLSPVQKPLVDTFQEFYTEMNGMEYIICIAESRDNYRKWANLAQESCSIETLEQRSVVGMKLSHVDATIQSMLPSTAQPRHLPASTGGLCTLPLREEEKLCSLEILCTDQCDDIKLNLWTEKQKQEIEQDFYRGRKITWENLWLADNKHCGDIIERSACAEASKLLDGILRGGGHNYSVAKLKIFHHPGSGGSTIARQVLWKNRKRFRCAVIKTSYPPLTVCNHVLALRDYEEKEIIHCFPVLLLIEDYDDEYLEDLQSELIEAAAARKMNTSRPYFILLCCRRYNDPERHCKASPLDTVAVTHKLTDLEKEQFNTKLENLQQKYDKPEFILTFVLMCKEFSKTYVSDMVEHILQGIDLSSRDTCLMRYIALLNCYVPNSYLSLSHCEAFLGLGAYTESTARAYDFKHHLSEQARMIFIELRESITYISTIRIIHCLVAKEILHQLSGNQSLSQIATNLLQEKTLFENRFGREEFRKFIRHLFIRRDKRSRGDNTDTLFSPFIEQVCETEDCEKAIAVLKAAYELLGKDPFFAQQLARLNYSNEKFEDAKYWANVAKSHLPTDSFILDTEGQVYRRWFGFTVDKMTEEDTPERITEKILLALEAMKCFRAAQQAAKEERESMNNAGYFGEVEVGCRLLRFLSTLPVFHTGPEREHTELVKYLTTDYIPEDIKRPWGRLHSRLKGLRQNLYNALEWISEELSYFQTDKNQEKDDENDDKEEQIHNPRKWLRKQAAVYAKFFISASLLDDSNNGPDTQLMRQMSIYGSGGGNVTNILSFLTDKKENRSAEKLERILSFYPENPLRNRLEDSDLINFILCHITLACLAPGSAKLLPLPTLRELSLRFFKGKRQFPASAYFLLTLLYWPDEALDKEPNPINDEILTSALQTLKRLYDIKVKDVPTRKKRIYTHFFLGKGYGLSKIVDKTKIDKLMVGSLDERRMKWLHGTVWNVPKIRDNLKRVSGWSKDRNLFIRGHGKELQILPLHRESVPAGSENVTFYLGFSFNGLVAFNIEVENDPAIKRT
ncbi:sterile alpha motif domain-containing protein 9-like [Ammospiza caudacuta]|uniref:sterile alpha motif domain-containing protein 9-like n=1 Tax=Ammospiza caudacuta TaxID=2857398 RepID=UPI00273975BE|nr:sterile alpha motif domain-containing protein 9-like [Ammospiza caudacuta]XP_058673376.1 sterile alpha motif domain-containing protein 9-like [Ammospiza caudacuta]